MQPIPATDAIGLAFTHTRTVLAPQPFRPGRFFKLALVAACAQSSFLAVAFVYPLQVAQLALAARMHRVAPQQFAGSPALAAFGFVVLAILLGLSLLLGLGLLYLTCRLRATLFDLVVIRSGHVRDAWRRNRRPGRRYMLLYLVALPGWSIVLAALLGPFFLKLFKTVMAQGESGAAPAAVSAAILPQIVVLVGLIWLLMPVWMAIDALLQDFILPVLALEQRCTLRSAFGRLASVMQRAPGQLLLFLVLGAIVALGITLALGLAAAILLGLLALVDYGLGKLAYTALWPGGLGAHALFFAGIAGMVLVFLGIYLVAVVSIYGVTGVFKTSYSAYFYAGYYPELAEVLDGPSPDPPDPLTPPPPTPPLTLPGQLW